MGALARPATRHRPEVTKGRTHYGATNMDVQLSSRTIARVMFLTRDHIPRDDNYLVESHLRVLLNHYEMLLLQSCQHDAT